MSTPDEFPKELTRGLSLELSNLRQLESFESHVARAIEPNLDIPGWEARPYRLANLVYTKGYNPNLGPIAIRFMMEPFARLQYGQQKHSGIKFNNGKGGRMNARRNFIGDLDQDRLEDLVGFSIIAAATSQSKPLGVVRVDAWYGPLSDDENNRAAQAGEVVLRAITLPKFDEAAFKKHYKASKLRGHSVRQGGSGKSYKGPRTDSH